MNLRESTLLAFKIMDRERSMIDIRMKRGTGLSKSSGV